MRVYRHQNRAEEKLKVFGYRPHAIHSNEVGDCITATCCNQRCMMGTQSNIRLGVGLFLLLPVIVMASL